LVKLQNTYVEALPNQVDKITNRIHTDYMQTVAATGRLSSNNPNLQNIPIRTERRQIRKAFVPEMKTTLWFLQIILELRNCCIKWGKHESVPKKDIHKSLQKYLMFRWKK
jgi:DNA polymerase I-like protein with 3'-5' exonuclease and polymerase domains